MIKLLHRGDTLNYPENTKESIISALNNKNYNGFEIDIRLTKDKKWIIFHDENLKKMCNINLKLKDCIYKNLPQIVFKNNNYKIPLLIEIVNLNYPLKIFNIEIKQDFKSTSFLSKTNLFTLLKKIKSPLLISSLNWEWYDWCLKNNFTFAHLLENDKIPNNGNIWIIDYKILNEKIINKIKKKNIKLGCFTIKNKKEINYDYDIEIWDN